MTCVTGTAPDGSTFKAEVPPRLERHAVALQPRLRAAGRPRIQPQRTRPIAPSRTQLLAEGFALAGSSVLLQRLGGPGGAARSDRRCSTASSGRFGKPRRTLAWGDSMGGMITAGLVERHPRRFDGALPMCGILGGAVGLWNQNLDLEYALKTLLSADPDPAVSGPASQLELVHIQDWQANVARANAAVTAAQATADGRARLALAAALVPPARLVRRRQPRGRRARTTWARQQQQFQALQFQLAFIFGFRRLRWSSAPRATRRGTSASTTSGCSRRSVEPRPRPWRSTGRAASTCGTTSVCSRAGRACARDRPGHRRT